MPREFLNWLAANSRPKASFLVRPCFLPPSFGKVVGQFVAKRGPRDFDPRLPHCVDQVPAADTIGAALKLRVIQGITASATRSRKPIADKVSEQSDPFRKTSPAQLKAEKRKADPT
jgi:hypothetical protein